MKHKLLFPIFIFLFLFPALLNAQCFPGWSYSMPITISNSNASPLTNFQVKITVNTATLIGAGQMLANGDDIRFADGACTNIEYWIESGINTATTYIWVKVPSIPASGNTIINMYYGNSSATPAANGDNVFLFFDDFNGASLNLSKWTVAGTPSTMSQSGGVLTFVGNSNWEYIKSNTTFSGPVVIEDREYSAGPSAAMILGYTGTDNRYTFRQYSSTKGTTFDPDVSGGNAWFDTNYPNVTYPTTTFDKFEIHADLVSNFITLTSFCDVTTASCNTNTESLNSASGSSFYLGYSTYAPGYTLYSDWIFARAFATQAPTSTNGPSQANNFITSTLSSTTFCAGNNFTFNFNAGGTFVAGNIFSAQLSDASGSFISPVVIGTLASSSTGVQTISCVIPSNTPTGNGYRVRVVSSNPVTTGSDNGNDIIIGALPTVTATAASSSICVGSSDVLTAAGATTYLWSSGGNASTETVSPISNSSYTVTGTDANGCINTATVSVNVNSLPNVSASAASGTICAGSNETLTATGATNYLWSSGGNSSMEIVSPVSSSTYTVTGTDVNGCSNSATVSVTVNSLPSVTASAATGTICDGSTETLTASGATNYLWSSGGNASVEIVSPTTNSTYTVTGTDANGCVNTATVSVNVNPLPNVSATASGTICAGSTETLTASGASNYSWSSGGTSAVEIVNPTTTSTYTVTGTDVNGCVNTATVSVIVNSLPVVDLGSDVTQCGGTVTLDAQNPGSTYLWSDNSTSQTLLVSASGIYSVSVTGSNGCSNSDTISVTINALPTVTGTASSTSVCLSDGAVTLTGLPAGGNWSGPGVSSSSFLPATAGVGVQTVTYTYTDVNGCSDTANVMITVNGCSGIITQPTDELVKIYPNPNNGEFSLYLPGSNSARVTIYNSIGQVVQNLAVTKNVSTTVSIETSGIYFLDVITTNGDHQTLRIVVNK